MKTILALWVKLNEAIWGFEVIAIWEGKVYRHIAKNEKEGIEWMQQYPSSAGVSIVSFGDDRIIARRCPVVVCS